MEARAWDISWHRYFPRNVETFGLKYFFTQLCRTVLQRQWSIAKIHSHLSMNFVMTQDLSLAVLTASAHFRLHYDSKDESESILVSMAPVQIEISPRDNAKMPSNQQHFRQVKMNIGIYFCLRRNEMEWSPKIVCISSELWLHQVNRQISTLLKWSQTLKSKINHRHLPTEEF